MKTSTVSSWCISVSLLLIVGLLSTTAWARFSAYHQPHGTSGYAHAHFAEYGGGYGAGTPRHDGHHDGMHMKHGKGHQDMYSSDRGHRHAERHGSHGRHAMHRGVSEFMDHMLKFQDGMSLTDDQVQQLHSLRTQYKKTRIMMKAEIKLANVDLHELLKDEEASLDDIETQLNALHALKAKLHMESIKTKRQARAMLSEEQQARMDSIHERIKSHGGTMRHHDGSTGYRKHNEHEQE